MFEKTLTDVVRGIRASKRDTALYISQCIAEIKTEINSSDMFVKANALQKLTFLQMMGYSMSWASFATIEVMSSPRFAHKRIGYLAASQGFTQDTEVILLTTNLLKKELRGAIGGSMSGVYEAGLAINCISNIVTDDLARDLLPEVTNLTSHTQPYLRKKAILCLFKLFVKYPQALRLTFAKLQACLDDPNSSVVSCAVNVITELSDKNPKNYLHLAPAFFDLLTKSSNNWMLIKVVKLLGSLVPEEPRLARKLLEPLAQIVRNTQAKSLLYEAVHTITLCLPYCRKSDGSMPAIVPDIVILCAQTLRSFVEEADQNLKYLGLVGFGSLMKSHPRVLSSQEYRPLILACLSDEDVTIRTRALDLLPGLASRKNLIELVTQLLRHVELASGSYKHDLVAKIIEMCCSDKYALLQDFEWYIDILIVQLGHMRGIEKHGDLLRAQITDVALRVLPVRAYAVRRAVQVLLERDGGIGASNGGDNTMYGDNGRGKQIMHEILPAAAWIVGEYADLIPEAMDMEEEDDDDEDNERNDQKVNLVFDTMSTGHYHSLVQALTAPMNANWLPTSTQKVYVQSACKVFAAASGMPSDTVTSKELDAACKTLQTNLPVFMQSTDPEVVERSFTAYEVLSSFGYFGGINLPGLTSASSDDSDESENREDLLGMSGTGLSTTVNSKSISGSARSASAALNYLYKPSPMKPVGAKAQRKKRHSPNGVSIDLNADVDLSVFEDMIAEEELYRSNTKLSTEAVTFTQQRPLKIDDAQLTSISSGPPMDLPSTSAAIPTTSFTNTSSASSSFQNRPTAGPNGPFNSSKPRQGDPFYLDSGPTNDAEENNKSSDNRFGTIQLLDSDEEQDKKKKPHQKKKKEKRSKTHKSKEPLAADTLLSFTSNAPQSARPASTILYESDDEDTQEDEVFVGKSKRTSKEFEGLAKVDLTTPLRADEVMPERKHRVVPDRPAQTLQQEPVVNSKSKKKSKKEKKKSAKSESKASNFPPSDAVGDLLDLGGFEPVAAPAAAPSQIPSITSGLANTFLTPAGPVGTNPINAAFDDLLGLSPPVPSPQLRGLTPTQLAMPTVGFESQSSGKKAGKRPWMRASVKLSAATGSPSGDWSRISLLYRVYRLSLDGGGIAASVVFRFENNGASDIISLWLDIKNYGNVVIGNVGPGSSMETSKVGPFSFLSTDDSVSIKGQLTSGGFNVPIKFALPASLYLEPVVGLSLEVVANELSAGHWASESCKVDVVSGLHPEGIKQMLSSFLHAGEVSSSGSNKNAATFAARSSVSGCPIRFLVKIKERSVKIDLKSTSQVLCRALASDLKHIIL